MGWLLEAQACVIMPSQEQLLQTFFCLPSPIPKQNKHPRALGELLSSLRPLETILGGWVFLYSHLGVQNPTHKLTVSEKFSQGTPYAETEIQIMRKCARPVSEENLC